MSTVPPSVSAMPLVTSGIATTPPAPVLVATPAASRLTQVSTVNVAALRPGAAPSFTWPASVAEPVMRRP